MLKHCITFSVITISCFRCVALASEDYQTDATSFPLEQLVETKFIPASTIANQISNASSAVSIVTAKDIKAYGYRTLAEILSSMKGLFLPQEASYSFLGGRGFPSNQYAGRVIVLIDGYRADDSMFGQGYLGHDGILDVALIERVEYIPGGGSAGYGDGALLGAINIITKKGSDIGGTQVAFGLGSQHAKQQRVSVGEKLENGIDILVSASSFGAKGNIQQEGDNDETNKRFFAKVASENLSFMMAYAKRDIHFPTYTYNEEDASVYADENAFAVLKYHTDIGSELKFSSSLWYGKYIYSSIDTIPTYHYINESQDISKWYGGDIKLIGNWFKDHTLSLGLGYRHDYTWQHKDYFTFIPTHDIFIENTFDTPRKTYSLYAYDDFVITPTLNFNYGMRYEKSDNDVSSMVSPRAALIYKPWEHTTLKLSSAFSNRQLTPDEGDFTKPEQAKTLEFVLEQKLGWQTKLTTSFYKYRVSNRIAYLEETDMLAQRADDIVAKGVEIELEKHWDEGTRLRASYAWQNAKESNGADLTKSPSHLAKLNLSTPLISNQLRMGTEAQYIGKYLLHKNPDEYREDYVLFNMNLLAHNIAPNLDVNFLVRDLFNASDKEKITQLPQAGRTFWLEMEYTFK